MQNGCWSNHINQRDLQTPLPPNAASHISIRGYFMFEAQNSLIIIPHIQIASNCNIGGAPHWDKPWQTHISIISLNTSCPLQTLTEFQPFVHVSPAFFEAPDVKLLPALGRETNVSSSTSLSRRNQLAKARTFRNHWKRWAYGIPPQTLMILNWQILKKNTSHFAVPIYTRMSHLLTWNMGICHIQSSWNSGAVLWRPLAQFQIGDGTFDQPVCHEEMLPGVFPGILQRFGSSLVPVRIFDAGLAMSQLGSLRWMIVGQGSTWHNLSKMT